MGIFQGIRDHLNQNLFNYGFNTQQSGQSANYSLPNMAKIAYGPTQALGAGTDEGFASSQNNPAPAKPSGFDMSKYQGWGEAEALADYKATGGPSGSSGGGDDSNYNSLKAIAAKGDLNPVQQAEWDALNQSDVDAEAERLLNEGYDQYYKMLDERLNSLGEQSTNMQGVAQNTYQQGMNTVDNQLATSKSQLDTNRQKTLRDLSENLAQSWRQGNTFLGTRGASDSSAANQYAYALTKVGNKSRGDVQSQYDQNMFNLKNTYDTETKNLELQKNSQLQQIAQWFAEAQDSLRQQKGEAAMQKSQQALSIAMQMAEQVRQDAAQKSSMLDQWAANNATSYNQLASQLGVAGNFSAPAPTTNLFGQNTTQQNTGVSTGYGANSSNEPYPIASMLDGRTRWSDGSIR